MEQLINPENFVTIAHWILPFWALVFQNLVNFKPTMRETIDAGEPPCQILTVISFGRIEVDYARLISASSIVL